jgi:uncharacterized protein (TIGR04222 family)
MTSLNPFDWTAAPFLMLYVWLIVICGLAVLWARQTVGPRSTATLPPLGMLDLAWLAGGRARAADTVLLSFIAAGAASIDDPPTRIYWNPDSPPLPPGLDPFVTSAGTADKRADFRSGISRELDKIRDRLALDGLVPGKSDLMRLGLTTAGIMLVPINLGLVRMAVGSTRGKPIGFLTALVFVTAIITLIAVCAGPRATGQGRAALERARGNVPRQTRAPRETEMAAVIPLAFAMFGPEALVGTDYTGLRGLIRADNSSGGGGDGGDGGCGGGGCGGCGS